MLGATASRLPELRRLAGVLAVLADRTRRLSIISISSAFLGGFMILTGLAQSAWQLAVARVGAGLGKATGYKPQLQTVGGLVGELNLRDYAVDANYVPRVFGMKGAVLWLRVKFHRRLFE